VKKLGYDLHAHLYFDEKVDGMGGKVRGFTDVEIRLDGKNTDMIIEDKRSGKNLSNQDIDQTIEYGKSRKVSAVGLTNAVEYQMFNSNTKNRLKVNGMILDDFPRHVDLPLFLEHLKPGEDDIRLTTSNIRESMNKILRPCTQDIFEVETRKSMADLEHIFKRCHDILRNREKKTPEVAFEEFSKMLFLKLYSEKLYSGKIGNGKLTSRNINSFDELSRNLNPHTVKKLVTADFKEITDYYQEVFTKTDIFRIKKPETFKELVQVLSTINFDEVDADVKGRAYEHFLSTVLKGSKLGQFFTPRAIVKMMVRLVNPKPDDLILDPACGSGGFLIKAMEAVNWHIDENPHERDQDKESRHKRLRDSCLYGADAAVVAKIAKMNMILAGDGHTNIVEDNSLTEEVNFLRMDDQPLFNIILTNPPFGLKEKLSKRQLEKYDLPNSRAQSLFLELMIRKVAPNGLVCTVVDEGVLNTPTYRSLRKYVFKKCYVLGVFSLPETTFKPHYSAVKASILLLRKKENELVKQDFPIFGYDLEYVGYDNTGRVIKNNDIAKALGEWDLHVATYTQARRNDKD
jgi:type I restriction enzyme M protein